MRISEIKKSIDDPKIVYLVSKDFWEEPVFNQALGKSRAEPTKENVFKIIRDVFLKYANNESAYQLVYIKPIYSYRRYLNKLSFRIYGDSLYWTIGTEYEESLRKRKQSIVNKEMCEFLYKRLLLDKKHTHDVIKYIAKSDYIRNSVLSYESEKGIETREDLYRSVLEGASAAIENNAFKRTEIFIMSSVSYLAHGDRNYWFEQNGLSYEKMIEELNYQISLQRKEKENE